jgi:DNA (cytosine-5)-methyltransferase 1
MSVMNDRGESIFDIKLSIEKDIHAHKTLMWRSFYRQFVKNNKEVPSEYYDAYRESNLKKREKIIESTLDKYPEGEIARKEAKLVELGSDKWPPEKVDALINQQLGKKPSDWVLIGGPPCQAYSNVGRSRVGGIHKEDHRVYLYKEYLRIIEKHSPVVFVMENVKGLLSAEVEGEKVFDWMKRDLQLDGKYEIHSFVNPIKEDKDFLIKTELYGVPQKRHRVILLGLRKGIEHRGDYLKPQKQVVLKSIIEKLPSLRSGLNREFERHDFQKLNANGTPKRIYINIKDSDAEWQRYLDRFIKKIKKWGDLNLNGLSEGLPTFRFGVGNEFVPAKTTILKTHPLNSWYCDPKLRGVANHQSRSHLTQDLMRYLFASLYVEKKNTFPRLADFARHSKDLVPDHANVDSGKFTDRFRVQVPDLPATTVTSHISKDGHYFIHYDPKQCRSLTVREAARIQTFPDNYLFRGSRTQQFHQVGNAVPPYLAKQIGEIVRTILS